MLFAAEPDAAGIRVECQGGVPEQPAQVAAFDEHVGRAVMEPSSFEQGYCVAQFQCDGQVVRREDDAFSFIVGEAAQE